MTEEMGTPCEECTYAFNEEDFKVHDEDVKESGTGITGEQIKAIVSAIAILVVQVAVYFGISLDFDQIAQFLFALVGVVVMGYGIWKNHNFTKSAAAGQHVTDELKRLS